MIRHERGLEELLEARLRPREVPPTESVWWGVRRRLGAHPRRARRVLLRAGLALAMLLALGAGLALASPDLRAWVGGVAVGLRGSSHGVASLEPAPPFTVLQPSALPAGWTLVANGYNPGPGRSGAPGWSGVGSTAPSAVSVASRVAGQDVPPATRELAQARAQDLLGNGAEAALALVYADPTGQLIEVVERSAAGKALPAGRATTVGSQPAVVALRDGQEVLAFVRQDTLVEVSGSAGRDDRLRLAASLQPAALAPVDATAAGQAPPTPPAWTRVPLSSRPGAQEPPHATREAIVRQCGWDAALGSSALGEAMQQVHCAARLAAASPDDQGAWAYSRTSWRAAAQQLGTDAAGPPGATQVYLVQLDVSERGGSVVVLDATTAQPYLVARLQPVTP
jgi:hypothetical protein